MPELSQVILRGTRASQPAAASNAGVIYCVTDEGNKQERSTGSAWESYGPTVELISEQAPSGTGTVTFSSIPSTYRHLRIVFTGRSTEVATITVANLRFNGDTGANYDGERGVFSTSATYAEQLGATSVNAVAVPGASATANYASGGWLEIPYYADTTFFKTFNAEMNYLIAQTTTNVQKRWYTGLWRSTVAISQIDIVLTAGNFVDGSKFTLYGIR